MKVRGLEIEEVSTVLLIKDMKTYLILTPFYVLFGLFFFGFGIFSWSELITDEAMWFMPLMGIAGGLIWWGAAALIVAKAFQMKRELNTRKISDEQKAKANSDLIKLLVACVAIIVVATVIILVVINGAVGSSGSSGSSGRKWSDLSDVEKDNARWAYEAQQYINSLD